MQTFFLVTFVHHHPIKDIIIEDLEQEITREKITKRYRELAESNDKDLQDIVLLASEICGTPIALITF